MESIERSLRDEALQLRRAYPRFGARSVVELYEAMATQCTTPPLYTEAWQLLVASLRGADWTTLAAVRDIYATLGVDAPPVPRELSLWHLKACLYCWAHSGGASAKEANEALGAAARHAAFLNMTPREAELELASHAARHCRDPLLPCRGFLLRLSTSTPRAFTLSYMTPLSGRFQHRRISHHELPALCAARDDLYALEWPLDGVRYASGAEIVAAVQRCEPRLSEERIARMLATGEGGSLYARVRRAFWPRHTTRWLEPRSVEARLGLTLSYSAAYEDD